MLRSFRGVRPRRSRFCAATAKDATAAKTFRLFHACRRHNGLSLSGSQASCEGERDAHWSHSAILPRAQPRPRRRHRDHRHRPHRERRRQQRPGAAGRRSRASRHDHAERVPRHWPAQAAAGQRATPVSSPSTSVGVDRADRIGGDPRVAPKESCGLEPVDCSQRRKAIAGMSASDGLGWA